MSARGDFTALAIALALLLATSSCVRVAWNRQSVHLPIPDPVIDSLRPGDDLESCLARLGAPIVVRELGRGEFVLAYGWLAERTLGVNVSVPVGDNYSASIDYDRIDRRVRGVVLFMDADERLVLARRGALRDLLADVPRARPDSVDERREARGTPGEGSTPGPP